MTTAFLHTLNIGTLAAWLSVTAFGTVGVFVPAWRAVPVFQKAEKMTLVVDDFTLGESEPSKEIPSEPKESLPANPPETLPAPPDLPSLAEFESLPEIPNLPVPAVRSADVPSEPKSAPPSRLATRPPGTTAKTAPPGKSSSPVKPTAGKPSGPARHARRLVERDCVRHRRRFLSPLGGQCQSFRKRRK